MRSRAVIGAAALGAAIVSGGWFLERGLGRAAGGTGRRSLFAQVMRRIATEYVDTIGTRRLYRLAIDGMLQQLHDPYSVFLTSQRAHRLEARTPATDAGLGIQVDVRDGWITVLAPGPGTPAERAGVLTGDRIVAVGGRSTPGLVPDEVLQLLRGPPGTRVSLTVRRTGVDEPLTFRLSRAALHARAIQWATLLTERIGYVDVPIIGESTAAELRRAIDQLRRRGMRALILDLRGSAGGLLEHGVDVSDLFLDSGQAVLRSAGRAPGTTRTVRADAHQPWPDLLLLVLVDGGTASASEIVAGSLQDHDRAVVVGTTTFGRGTAQSVYRIPDGGALRLTVARWYTPSGRSIQKPGDDSIAPAAADDHAPGDSSERAPPGHDTFRTDGGRPVYGGGGITPDVVVAPLATDSIAVRFQQVLGADAPRFREVLTRYALTLAESHGVTHGAVEVTPAMLAGLWTRLEQRGVEVGRADYAAAASVVAASLGDEVARDALGPEAEFRRRIRRDRTIQLAVALATGAATEHELITRAIARHTSSHGNGLTP